MLQEVEQENLLANLRSLIDAGRSQLAHTVNQEMTLLYWNIGKTIQTEILKFEKPEYGEQVIEKIGSTLQSDYGRGFGPRVLQRTIQFYSYFPDLKMASTLSTRLTWSHFVELLPIQDKLKREFYAEMCRIDSWSVRTLREKIGKMLYERTAISQQPDKVIEDSLSLVKSEDKLTPQLILQDPYVIDFLNLPQNYSESQLESSILDQIERFLLELGAGFCFVGRQKRISVGGEDFYIDLLLYNRYLKRLIVIELKTTHFKPAHKGQMELYLNWLNKYERQPDEDSPIGIILCANKDKEVIKLFDLVSNNIHVAQYLTVLPPKEVFEKKVQDIINKTMAIYSVPSKDDDEE
jgi:predicted nuclease of restriction endonuclease-like (RecB) superfamily